MNQYRLNNCKKKRKKNCTTQVQDVNIKRNSDRGKQLGGIWELSLPSDQFSNCSKE